MEHPVTHCMGGRDKRYTVTREWCGYPEPRYVARFCGEWIGQSKFCTSATMLCIGESQRRAGALIVEAMDITKRLSHLPHKAREPP